ncbi:Nucleoside triphosphate pyrophosphatase Maf-like protein [Dillenia turbinata]|uniref:Nucleoside triphosphate pyrophosphatase Maf-like protein n=1 Tax=Dillenia turbinata TaxID=194707 RepID=A0AAN8V4U2_9MAGN
MAVKKNTPFKIILGSSSMARRKILAEMGYEFTIMTADIDEKSIRKEKPQELVMALAKAKADAIVSRLQTEGYKDDDSCSTTLLITADTTVVIGSVLVTNLRTGVQKGEWDRAEVYFHDIPNEVIDDLIEEGIVLNVSGALMLEHPLTLPFVHTVVGDSDSIMGLSKTLTEKLIQEAL